MITTWINIQKFLIIYVSLKSKSLSRACLITAYVGIYHVANSDGSDLLTTALRKKREREVSSNVMISLSRGVASPERSL